jgi:hypothetical protein
MHFIGLFFQSAHDMISITRFCKLGRPGKGDKMGRHGDNVIRKKCEIRVLDPSGAHEITHLFAKRPGTLDGKVVAELASDPVKWQPHRTFPLIEAEIKERYPSARFISYTEFPQGLGISDEAVAAAVKAKGADACIVGNAA